MIAFAIVGGCFFATNLLTIVEFAEVLTGYLSSEMHGFFNHS